MCKEATPIDNCEIYSNKTTCKICKNTHILSENKCLLKIASHCLTHKDPSTCASCPDNYTFNNVIPNQVDCVEINLNGTNCALMEADRIYCKVCDQNYYLEKGECLLVPKPIPNCLIYENATLCDLCENGYMLDRDGLCELQTFLDHCKVAIEYDDCTMCAYSYYFDDKGNCISNSGEDKYCLTYHPKDLEKCLLCQDTSYMDENGKCISYRDQGPTPNSNGLSIFMVQTFIMVFFWN